MTEMTEADHAEVRALMDEFTLFRMQFSQFADHFAIIAHFVRHKLKEQRDAIEEMDSIPPLTNAELKQVLDRMAEWRSTPPTNPLAGYDP